MMNKLDNKPYADKASATHLVGSEDERLNDSIDEQAALWFTRQHSQRMTPTQRAEFKDWMLHDAHQHAYQAIAELWRNCDDLPRPATPTIEKPKRSFWRPITHTMATFCLVAILYLPYSHLPALLMDNMTLATSDLPKEMTLADGSKVFLDRNSQVRVAYIQTERQLWLDKGQAYFKVKSNPYRPFYVHTDNSLVKVVGTEFEVSHYQNNQTSVAVHEGIVEVRASKNAKPTYLYAGTQATSLPTREQFVVSAINPDFVGSWRFGQLHFFEQPLTEVIAKLKPYLNINIQLASPDLAKMKVSGVANIDDAKSFITAIPLILPVNVIFTDKNNVLIINK
ncbi:FecR family protein [Proteus myxofaciens]|uniref:Putative transmembrane sensor n=1 Tax=Proteus myxofaciens ATCC 19692 TaxID=1354337 RepID=A0A198FMU1_9GAMM|nr:FecR domain-containing protein [Proteus myxofaciens]OAT26168.1 putative transmembrane sensor [Proteus myxofaciens ATCC 19692]